MNLKETMDRLEGKHPHEGEIKRLQAENERLRKDAERYRFLRDVTIPTWLSFQTQWRMTADQCDEQIDKAALAAKEEG